MIFFFFLGNKRLKITVFSLPPPIIIGTYNISTGNTENTYAFITLLCREEVVKNLNLLNQRQIGQWNTTHS